MYNSTSPVASFLLEVSQKENNWAWGGTECVQYWLHQHGDISVAPQNAQERLGMVSDAHNSRAGAVETGRSLELSSQPFWPMDELQVH